MLNPAIPTLSKETANFRRKSFFDFLEPAVSHQKPRSNSMGVIEAPRQFSSQRFSYQSPSYESPSNQSTPFARQRTKCFTYPSFSNGKQFDSPIMVVTGGSPSVLDYGRMINKFSEGVNKKYGCRTILALVLLLSLTGIVSVSLLYYSGSSLFANGFFILPGLFQTHTSKAILNSVTKANTAFPDLNSNSLNGRGFTQPSVINTVVGQHRVSTGFSQISKVAKDKIIFDSKLSEKSKVSSPSRITEPKLKEKEFKVGEMKDEKFNRIRTMQPDGLGGMKFIPEGRRDVNSDEMRREFVAEGRRPSSDPNTNSKTRHPEHGHVYGEPKIQTHEHGYQSFMKDSGWTEDRFTISSNKRKEDIWRNGGNHNYQPQHSYRRPPSGIYPPPGINPRVYDRGFDF